MRRESNKWCQQPWLRWTRSLRSATCSPSTARSSSRPPASCEVYDPATDKVERDRLDEYWAAGPQRDLARRRRVLVAGGVGAGDPGNLASAELYQP